MTMPGPADRRGGFTLVSFHAHPDDEALLTGGTLARVAAEGHRVVVVFATRGEAGSAADRRGLGARRTAEAEVAAAVLGVSRLVFLDYADSGSRTGEGGAGAFSNCDIDEAAGRLAKVLREEGAQVLTIYDVNGGYGHPDHRRVHVVGSRAAFLAGTPVVLEASVPREPLLRGLWLLRFVPGLPQGFSTHSHMRSFLPRQELTHSVDVRGQLQAKRQALKAHASQRTGLPQGRTIGFLLRLPRPIFSAALGHEWFREQGRAGGSLVDDPFHSLRAPERAPRPATR
jgi:LmbE family N-acetylglucosaminyl deacetylase